MFQLKKLKHKDYSSIEEFCKSAKALYEEYYSRYVAYSGVERMCFFLDSQVISREIKEGEYEYYLVLSEYEIAGVLVLKLTDGAIGLQKIFIKKSERRKGAAGEVIKILKEKAQELRVFRIRTAILKDDEECKNIFSKFGFEKKAEAAKYIGDGVYMYTDIYELNCEKNYM